MPMQTRSTTKCTDIPHDLDAFNSYPSLGDWNVPNLTILQLPALPPMPKNYDPAHFCQSWCKCCEDNLMSKVEEEKVESIAYQRMVARQLLCLGVPELTLGPRQ